MVQAPVKTNERNNEQSKHNMPLQILWSWGIKYQSKPNICGNNRSLIRPDIFRFK